MEQVRLATELFGHRASSDEIATAYGACAKKFIAQLNQSQTRKQQLARVANVADDYSDLAQTFGVFPLTSIPVSIGWENWKKKHLPIFRQPIGKLVARGRIVEWGPPPAFKSLNHDQVRARVERSRDAALGIPEPRSRVLKQLFETFAPIWQVDVVGHYDYAGHPEWTDGGASIRINPSKPSVFTHISHVIHDGQILLQLNYAIWFQARPRSGPLDLLGGHLDGVIWRVTLGRDGRPLIYDTIHACGCYHLLFPVRNGPLANSLHIGRELKERPAVLPGPKAPRTGQRIVLRLASGSHYLLGIAVAGPRQNASQPSWYHLIDGDVLRSLPLSPSQKRSLFGPNGLVAGTERLERFLLWPTGVKSPGALRQWGRHAIAFAERRHFDDPLLFKKIFK